MSWQSRIGVWKWRLGQLADSLTRMFGAIAKRLKYPALATVPVSAAMLQRVDTVDADAPLADAAKLFIAGRASQVPVLDHGQVVGVITRDAVASALLSAGPSASVAEAPCRNVIVVAPTDSLADVLDLLRATPDSIALVCDHGSPVGLLTEERLAAYVESHAAAAA